MPVCKKMQAAWSNETLMVKIAEQDGANTVILATRDATTELNNFENFRIYNLEVKSPAVALKNHGHMQHS